LLPVFRVEPNYSLLEVINRVETLYPEYRPHLTVTHLADYQLQVARRAHAQELEKIIAQASDLKDGLVDLTKKLRQIGASQDREIAEDLASLHHQLSDLRAHVDIARREVALARMIGAAGSGMGLNPSRSNRIPGLMRGISQAKAAKPRGIDR
jgi:hypothetical protein